MRARSFGVQQARAAAHFGEFVPGVAKRAIVDRQAAASDARRHLVAQPDKAGDPIVEFVAPFGGQPAPVGGGDRRAVGGEAVQPVPDDGKQESVSEN